MSEARRLLAALVDMLERSNTAHLNYSIIDSNVVYADDLIKAANELLAKPSPEPVAYAALDKDTGKATFWSSRKENVESYIDGKDGFYLSAIYAEPPARSPMPDVEISKAFCDETGMSIGDTIEDAFEAGVRFGEQYHGIKEQE
jgi:hypothetical protein